MENKYIKLTNEIVEEHFGRLHSLPPEELDELANQHMEKVFKGMVESHNSKDVPKSNELGNVGEYKKAADEYATLRVPNPSPFDAPYYTTGEKYDDLKEAFEAGAEYILNQKKC